MNREMGKFLRSAAVLFAASLLAVPTVCGAQDKPIRIGLVTFLSGPAAGPFGVPAKLAAEAIVESLNAGKAPAPYATRGFGGTPLELVVIDEAGGATKQVTELRNLVERQNVDFVIGYISSGDCLAVAPVAEELKKITILFDCGTPRVFEDASYRYVFRTRPHATMDAVAGALYLLENRPAVKTMGGINQNYAWGQDSWADFTAVMAALKPELTITTSQMPKFGAGQYGPEISALLESNSDVIHSSLWGGDLEAFMLQSTPRNLFARSQLILVAGEPYLHHRRPRTQRGLRAKERVERLAAADIQGARGDLSELSRLQRGTGVSWPEDCLRKGEIKRKSGYRRDNQGIRIRVFRFAERQGHDEAWQGPPGSDRDRLRNHTHRQWRNHRWQHQVLPD